MARALDRQSIGGLVPDRDPTTTMAPSYADALAWFETRFHIVESLIETAHAARQFNVAARLCANLVIYLLRREFWTALKRVTTIGVASAVAAENTPAEIQLLQALAIALQSLGDDDGADPVFERLRILLEKHGDDAHWAPFLAQWAQSERRRGKTREANRMLREAIVRYRAAGSVLGEARTLDNLANLLDDEGATILALEMRERRVLLLHDLGLPADEAKALQSLGLHHVRHGNWAAAERSFEQAADVASRLGDKVQETENIRLTAGVRWTLGDAEDTERLALSVLPELLRQGAATVPETEALIEVARLHRALDAFVTAPTDYERRDLVSTHPDLVSAVAREMLTERLRRQGSRDAGPLREAQAMLATLRLRANDQQVENWWVRLGGDGPIPAPIRSVLSSIERTANPDRRVVLWRAATRALDETQHPLVLARLESRLGIELLRARRSKDAYEEAIAVLSKALRVIDKSREPDEWAVAQNELGCAFRSRFLGDRDENLRQAITCFRRALSVYNRASHPDEWAATLNNLANVYRFSDGDDRDRNLERAIYRYRQVLTVFTPAHNRPKYALVQLNLARAVSERTVGDQSKKADQVFSILRTVMTVREALPPAEKANLLILFGNISRVRREGDHSENIRKAISAYEEAIAVFTTAGRPLDAAVVSSLVGNAWSDLGSNTGEYVEEAIRWYERCLTECSAELAPSLWAGTLDNLANAITHRPSETMDDNIERAIELREQALEVYGPDFEPLEWARVLYNLAGSLLRRRSGLVSDNVARAVELYQHSLAVRERSGATPIDWAESCEGLATALALYGDSPSGEALARAVRLYRQALEVFDPIAFPDRARTAASRLGDVLSQLGQWKEATRAYGIALDSSEHLYRAAILRSSKDVELTATGDLARRSAYALARIGRLREAITVLEYGRARSLGEALARDRADLARIESTDPAVYDAYLDAVQRVRAVEMAERVQRVGDGIGTDQRSAERVLRTEKRDAEAELAAVIGQIQRLGGANCFLSSPTFAEIASASQSSCPLIYLATTGLGSLILSVCDNGLDADTVVFASWPEQVTTDLVNELLAQWNGTTLVGGWLPAQAMGGSAISTALDATLDALRPLMAPVSAHLSDDTTGVVLIPTGPLALFPLHAVPLMDGSCLIDTMDVVYAPSARARSAARLAKERTRGATCLAAIGDPGVDLPFAALEVALIAEQFECARVRTHSDGTIAALVSDLDGATHLHFACHGAYSFIDPMSSCLFLANGPLTVRDVIGQRTFFPIFASSSPRLAKQLSQTSQSCRMRLSGSQQRSSKQGQLAWWALCGLSRTSRRGCSCVGSTRPICIHS